MENERTHSSQIHDRAGDTWPADPTPKLTVRKRLALIRLMVSENAVEVKNDIGGVVGYTLSLDEDKTRELWNLVMEDWCRA